MLGTGFYILAALVIAATAISYFQKGKRPEKDSFSCSKCGKMAKHDDRTIEAWRIGKVKFFCRNCHREWIKTKPIQETRSHKQTKPGCAIVILATFSIGTSIIWIILS